MDSVAYDSIEALDFGVALKCTRHFLRISINLKGKKYFKKSSMGFRLCSVNFFKDTISLINESVSLIE